MKRYLRLILIVVLVAMFVAGGLIHGLIVYATGPRGGNHIAAAINRLIPGSLGWEGLDVHLFAGRIRVTGFYLEGPEQDDIAGFHFLEIDWSWLSVLKGRLRFNSIRLDNPRADLGFGPEDRLNIVAAFTPTAAKKETDARSSFLMIPLAIRIDSLEIHEGRFALSHDVGGLDIRMEDIRVSLEGDVRDIRASARIGAGPGHIAMNGMHFPLQRLDAEAVLAQGKISPLRIRLDTKTSWAELNGAVSGLTARPGMEFTLQTGVFLDELAQWMDLAPGLTGEVNGHATARGYWPEMDVNLRLDMNGGGLYGQGIERARLRARLEGRKIRIHPAEVFIAGGRLSLGGDIDLTSFLDGPGAGPITFISRMDVKGVDLGRLAWLDGYAGGAVGMSLTAEGQGRDLPSLIVSGRIRVEGEDMVFPWLKRAVSADMNAGLAISDRRFDVNGLAMRIDGVNASGSGAIGLETGSLNAGILLEADGAALFSLFGVSGSDGRISVTAKGGGDVFRPEATAAIEASSLRIADIAIGDLNARVSIDKAGVARMKAFRLRNGRSDLKAAGGLRFRPTPSNPEVDLKLRLDAFRPDDFFEHLPFVGDVAGDIHVRGGVRSPEVKAALKGENIGVRRGKGVIAFDHGEVAAELDADGWITVSSLRLAHQGGALLLRGNLRPFREWKLDDRMPVNALLEIDGVDLGAFSDGIVNGRIKGVVRLGESLLNPDARVNIGAENLRVKDVALGSLRLDARLHDGCLEIDECSLINNQSVLMLGGSAGLTIGGGSDKPFVSELALTIQGEDIRMEDFFEPVSGGVVVDARLNGTAPDWSGYARLNAEGVFFKGWSIGDLFVAAALDGDVLRVEPLVLSLPGGGNMNAGGWIAASRAFEFHASSPGIDISGIEDIHSLQLTEGILEMNIRGHGALDNPEINGELRLKQSRAGGTALPEGVVRLGMKDRIVDLDIEFDPVRAGGRLNLTEKTVSASLQCMEADLAPYFAIAGREEWTGRLTMNADVDARLDRPDLLSWRVLLDEFSLAHQNNPVVYTRDAAVRFTDNRIDAQPVRVIVGGEGEIVVQGEGVSLDDVAITLQGGLPLRTISMFIDEPEDIVGDLTVYAEITGALYEPEVRADMILQGAGFTVPYLRQSLRGVNGHLHLTHEKLILGEVKGFLDDGAFSVSGEIALTAFTPTMIDLHVSAMALPIRIPDTMEMTTGIRLHVSGTPDASFARGEVVLLEGVYYRDFKINPLRDMGRPKREEIGVDREINLPFLRNLAMDVAFFRRTPFRIDNNLAELLVSPDIQFAGTLNRPLIRGRAAVDSGTVFYSKREFVVEKGVIDFINPYKIEPLLDIRGRVSVRHWTISLEVTGPPDEIVFRLSSEPPEEDADILSLLVFGKTGRELTMGDGHAPKSAGEMLIELVISSRIGDDIKNATGLDILEIRKGLSNNANGVAADDPFSLVVGKELSRRITIKYALESLKGEFHQRTIAEYAFFENILFNGFQDSSGNFGGEVKFRLEFR